MRHDMKQNIITAPSENNIAEERHWEVSGNLLCKYMREEQYLLQIIDRFALVPRYNEESLDYLQIDGYPSISFPMICFCDTPLRAVNKHKDKYGVYGIAFDKSRIVKQGDVQPILYLNEDSKLFSSLKTTLLNLIQSQALNEELEYLANAFLDVLLYTKPIDGYMPGDTTKRIFQDECEWRYIPEVSKDIDLILPPNINTDKGRALGCKAMEKDEKTWLKFNVDDIKYLIVPDKIAAQRLIKYIERKRKFGSKSLTRQQKNILISKVTIASDLEGDI